MKKALGLFALATMLLVIGFASVRAEECVTGGCYYPLGNGIGPCLPIATPGVACSDDGNICTTDVCGALAFQCLHNPIAGCCNSDSECDDSNPLTLDSCISHACSHYQPPIPTPCDDGNACTANDMSVLGICTGTPISCDDNNPLTTDSCNPETGCVHDFDNIGTLSCDDENECTNDINLVTGCIHIPVTLGASCEGGTCNGDGQCMPTPIVPEFATIIGMLTALSALGIFFIVRRSK